jgi:hypothetical protein
MCSSCVNVPVAVDQVTPPLTETPNGLSYHLMKDLYLSILELHLAL